MAKQGYAAFTYGGVNDWTADMAQLCKGAAVYVLADNDEPGRCVANIIQGDLQGIAKSAKVIVPVPDIPKADISDYFAAGHSKAEFESLLQQDGAVIEKNMDGDLLDLSQFHLVSEKGMPKDVFDSRIVEYLIKNMDLMIYNNVLYTYVGGVYVKDKEGSRIKSKIQTLIYDELQTSIRINRVYALLMCTSSLVVTEEETNTYPAHWINFKNGMLDVISGRLKEHKPEYHSMNQIPHDYIVPEQEKELTFCKFLESRMSEDDRQMLYEFFALCLNIDMSFQKMMYIVGVGEVGKSLVLEYINHIVGRENVSHISPQNLSRRFQSAFLMHKLLNSVSDISSKAIREASVIKQLSGEDAIPAEYKGGDVFSFYNTSKMHSKTSAAKPISAARPAVGSGSMRNAPGRRKRPRLMHRKPLSGRKIWQRASMPMLAICPVRNQNGRRCKSAPRFERKESADMKIELDYVKVGNYYLSNLTLEPQPDRSLGKYGLLRRQYLKEHRSGLYNRLALNGTLYAHLLETEDAAQDLLDSMMPEMAKEAGAAEELKARDPMRWVGLMNCCKAQVEEIIFAELIYC